MPVGYLVGVLLASVATALSLWPRPTRGPRATPAFVLASAANELPFLVMYWLVADTALAAVQGDITTPLGWVGLAIAVLTVMGSAEVIRRALRAGDVLERALTAGLGDDWRNGAEPGGVRRGSVIGLVGRVLVAPLRIPTRGVRRERNVQYGPAGGANSLDVVRHRSRPVGCPVFIYFHPGGFFSGHKSREARALFDRLAKAGWVCISANYRLGAAGEFPNNLIDAKRVIAWVRWSSGDRGFDPNTLVVCGGSSGAHLAAMCALTPNVPSFQPGFGQIDTSVSAAVGFYGFYGSSGPSDRLASDPGSYARPGAPPFFIIHGERDPMIPAAHARLFAEQLVAKSSDAVLYAELPGGQHNFDRFPSFRFFKVVGAVESFANWVRAGSMHQGRTSQDLPRN